MSDDLREREDDVIWRVRLGPEWLYVYLLIEFQSRPDPFMALRILVYTGLLYQELVKGGHFTHNGKLPPVFPLVLYNGEPPWGAAQDVSELIEPVPGLMAYRPHLRYLLLDEGRLDERGQARVNVRDSVGKIIFEPGPSFGRNERPRVPVDMWTSPLEREPAGAETCCRKRSDTHILAFESLQRRCKDTHIVDPSLL